jgi:hypothetical protein
LHGLNYSKINGRLNTTEKELLINADVPFFGYEKIQVTNASVKGSGNETTLNVLASIDNLALNDSISFPNTTLRINTIQDTTKFALNTSTSGPLGDAEIDGMVFSHPNGFEAFFNESSFIINNKKWTINRQGNIAMNHGYFTSTGLTLQQNEQQITMYTEPSGEGNWNDFKLSIKNLNTEDLMPYILKEPRIEGLASGEVTIVDPSGNMHVHSDIRVDEFRFNNDSIGVVNLSAEYSGRTKRGNAHIESKNKEYDFSGSVLLDLNDSASQQINTVVPVRNLRVNVLQKYLAAVFDQVDGYATGDIQVVGKLKSPSLIGKVRLTNGVLKVGYTKCVYKVDTGFLAFGDNYIDFGKLTVKDEKNRTGTVEGKFYHRFFDSLSFDLHFHTNGMEVLNTSGKDNDLFFWEGGRQCQF